MEQWVDDIYMAGREYIPDDWIECRCGFSMPERTICLKCGRLLVVPWSFSAADNGTVTHE